MLVLHPSSRCDVCLDSYLCSSADTTPTAIACGHIFCRTCLASLHPSTCPLCRKPFAPDRAKRLHVDKPPPSQDGAGGGEGEGARAEADTLLQQIALVSGEHTPAEDARQIVAGVEQWLAVQPADPNLVRFLTIPFPPHPISHPPLPTPTPHPRPHPR